MHIVSGLLALVLLLNKYINLYKLVFHRFNVYVENFQSYVCMFMCGLRLSNLNKETTYLLTYLRISRSLRQDRGQEQKACLCILFAGGLSSIERQSCLNTFSREQV